MTAADAADSGHRVTWFNPKDRPVDGGTVFVKPPDATCRCGHLRRRHVADGVDLYAECGSHGCRCERFESVEVSSPPADDQAAYLADAEGLCRSRTLPGDARGALDLLLVEYDRRGTELAAVQKAHAMAAEDLARFDEQHTAMRAELVKARAIAEGVGHMRKADDAQDRSEVLSGLLRGMARRATELRWTLRRAQSLIKKQHREGLAAERQAAERDDEIGPLRARLAAVRALADDWDREVPPDGAAEWAAAVLRSCARDVRAVLRGPAEAAEPAPDLYEPGGPLCGCNECEQVRQDTGVEELTDQLRDFHGRARAGSVTTTPEPTARDPWTVTLCWTPDQNFGAVAVHPCRSPFRAVLGLLRAGETLAVVAAEFGLTVQEATVLARLADDLAPEPDGKRVGRCGASPQRIIAKNLADVPSCTLPAQHPGFHHDEDTGAQWGRLWADGHSRADLLQVACVARNDGVERHAADRWAAELAPVVDALAAALAATPNPEPDGSPLPKENDL